MNILDIKKFVDDENAWYLLQLPIETSQEEMMRIKGVLDNSKLKGTFLLVIEDYKITDVTEYMKEYMKEQKVKI